MKIRILWVDADKALLSGYVDELVERGGFEVEFVDNVDDAVARVRDPRQQYSLVIWEMIMPPGKIFGGRRIDTADGLTTGRCFQALVKDCLPSIKTLLFTTFREIVLEWNIHDEGMYALGKRDYKPEQFVARVYAIMQK
jgi:CheY-like chemotaxis protein